MRAVRGPFTVALLAVALAGCSSPDTGTGGRLRDRCAHLLGGSATPRPGSPRSRGPARLPVQARDLRLVRLGTAELALQFEFANNMDRPVSPDTLGIDQIERIMMLVDLPRGTTYEMLTAQGLGGRLSENNGDEVPPVERSR